MLCNVIFIGVKEFITYRRYENINLHYIIQGLKTSDFSWLGTKSTSGHVPVSDLLKRRDLLEDFLFWYFSSFLLPLLRVSGTLAPLSLYFK